MSSFWSKTKKSAARSKQVVAAKMGASEETVDAEFNFEKERFRQYYAQVKEMEHNSARMMKAMKEFTEAQSALFESISVVFPPESNIYEAVLDGRLAASEMDTARVTLEQNIDTNILKPILRYKMQFKEMKGRMNSWEKKKVDLDRYKHDVKAHRKAGKDLKEQAAQQKLDLATHNFDMLNQEIQHDLSKLYEDRIPFVEPLFATVATCGLEYYIASTGAISKTASAVGRIDRAKSLSHPFVITPKEDSAAYSISSKSFAPRDNLMNISSSSSQQSNNSPSNNKMALYQQGERARSESIPDDMYYKRDNTKRMMGSTQSIDLSSPLIEGLPSPIGIQKQKSESALRAQGKTLPDLPMPPPPPFESLPTL